MSSGGLCIFKGGGRFCPFPLPLWGFFGDLPSRFTKNLEGPDYSWLISEVGIPTAVDLIETMDLMVKMVVERDGRSFID